MPYIPAEIRIVGRLWVNAEDAANAEKLMGVFLDSFCDTNDELDPDDLVTVIDFENAEIEVLDPIELHQSPVHTEDSPINIIRWNGEDDYEWEYQEDDEDG